jgi:hypothetical protein
MPETIGASVGKYGNGTKECYNFPKDQSAIIRLLNQIGKADGGCKEDPLPGTPRLGKCSAELYDAITRFQRRVGGLPLDGHVDPGGPTLRKLNEVASRQSGAVKPEPVAPGLPAGAERTCDLAPTSPFASWPSDLLETICRSYKAHASGNRYLDNAFWGGAPTSFDDAISRIGVAEQNNALKWLHTRAAAITGLWPFIKFIHNLWSGDSHGFAFTCTDKVRLRAFLDSSASFCRDIPTMMSDHQAAGPAQCWREIISGIAGLHICVPTDDAADQRTVAGESSIHIDPHQIVKAKDADGTCSYSATGLLDHARDVGAGVVRRRVEEERRRLEEELRKIQKLLP